MAPRIGVEGTIARRSFGQLWVGATVCAATFGISAASAALTYVSTFPTQAERDLIARTTGADRGLAILLGPIGGLDTVGGYTTYKGFVFLTSIAAIWAVLTTTRILRGEEDAGRWQLLLAGATTPSRATGAALVATAAAVGIVFIGTTLGVLLALVTQPDVGFDLAGCVAYGLSLAVVTAVFAAIGAVASQLGRTRRTATALGMTAFGLSFALRMVGDAAPSTAWVRWITPLGWAERIEPLTRNDLLPVVPAALAVGGLSAVAVALAGRRDVGDGVLAGPDAGPMRPFGLGSPFGLAVRLELGVLVAWAFAAVLAGLLFGMVAEIATGDLPPSFDDTLDRFVRGRFLDQYLSVVFLMVATIVALIPAGQVGAAAEEETSGRLTHLLAAPVRRSVWLAGRLAIAAAAVTAASILAGAATWAGARSQGISVDAWTLLGAGLNVVPVALLALGIGAVGVALVPRQAARVVYLVVLWSVIVDLVSSMVRSVAWLRHASLFDRLALAPAARVDLSDTAVTLLVALALCVAAVWAFGRRDLRSA